MDHPDWSRFELRIPVRASAGSLFRAWTTTEGLERWFLRLAEFVGENHRRREADECVSAGDRYRFLWHGWTDDVQETGVVLQVDAAQQFAFSFGQAGRCHIAIRPEGDWTLVTLVQDEIPADESGKFNWHVGCKTGWTFYLANLKSVYEGGLDLRNRELKYQAVLNS